MFRELTNIYITFSKSINLVLCEHVMRYLIRILKLFLFYAIALNPHVLNAQEIQTEFQVGGHKKYSTLNALYNHMEKLQYHYPQLMNLAFFGKSLEGRDLPLAIMSDPLVKNFKKARKLRRPIVLIGANIHGDEKTMREASLIFMTKLLEAGSKKGSLLKKVFYYLLPH